MDDEAAMRDAGTAAAPPQVAHVVLERGPGVHVVADAHPTRAGRALAAELGADFADTAASAEVAIRARLALTPAPSEVAPDSSGPASTSPHDPERALAPGRRVASAGPDPLRTLAAAHVAHLRQLAAAVERTDRVRARTERATTDRLASSQTSVALHPESLRHAAAALLEARRTLAALEDPQALVRTPDEAGSGVARSAGSKAAGSDRATGYTPVAIGVLLLSVALAGALLLTNRPVALALAPVLVGVCIAARIRARAADVVRRGRTPSFMPLPDEPRRPVIIDAATAGEQTGTTLQRVAQTRTEPISATAVARQQLEEAERAWTSLAGGDADPHDVEEVVRRSDPQATLLRAATADTPTVRAATQVTIQAREAWEAAWRDLGEEAPPGATSGPPLDAALARLEDTLGSSRPEPSAAADEDDAGVIDLRDPVEPVHEPSRARLGELLAQRSLDAVGKPGLQPTAPLVLVEPFAGLGPGRRSAMQRQLERLAAHHEVIVVVGSPSANSPDDTQA